MRKKIAVKSIHLSTSLRIDAKKGISRIIDANLNRAKEGLRVCEEIARFIFDEHRITAELKRARHKIDALTKRLPVTLPQFLEARESRRDIGRDIYINELKRNGIHDIFFANIQRVKESLRVIEEFSKLIRRSAAVEFKNLRYTVYELEKKIIKRIPALRNP